MRISFLVAVTALMAITSTTNGQRPANVTICEYYSNGLPKGSIFAGAANEYLLIKKLVNTVVIGNYTVTITGQIVPGILANATVNGQAVSLLKYFDGSMNTSNVNGAPAAVNYLDAGGATPLTMNQPSNDSDTCASNQCMLLTHLYQLFGKLLGCSQYNSSGFPVYAGSTNMYQVHKFMYLNNAENAYFIQQVGAVAAAYALSTADVTVVTTSLTKIFNRQCSMPIPLDTGAPAAPQSICNVPGCVLASPAYCAAYVAGPTTAPAAAPGTAPPAPPGTAPAGTAPAGTAPAGTTPAGTAPVGTAPAPAPAPRASSASKLGAPFLVLIVGAAIILMV